MLVLHAILKEKGTFCFLLVLQVYCISNTGFFIGASSSELPAVKVLAAAAELSGDWLVDLASTAGATLLAQESFV